MSSSSFPAPDRDRRNIERDLVYAVEQARAELQQAKDPAIRAAAAGRLRAAVQALMEFTGTNR